MCYLLKWLYNADNKHPVKAELIEVTGVAILDYTLGNGYKSKLYVHLKETCT